MRHHMTPNGSVPFTPEEEAEWDAQETQTANDRMFLQWQNICAERNMRLYTCDWTQLPDAPLSDAQRQDWAAYRQTLRDLPANTLDPFDVTWPEMPVVNAL